MYNTGNTTKNSSIQLGRNIVVNEPCPDIDFRYGPYSSVAEAENWIDRHLRAIGLTVGIIEDGEVVEYWFKSDTTHLVKKINDSEDLYSPNESIPDDAISETVSASKSSLQGQTISQILDKILFKDSPAYINDNAGNCSISAKNSSKEVGTSHTTDLYKTTVGIAKYGYPVGQKSWQAGTLTVNRSTITFGNGNSCSCSFTLTGIPTLKSSYGVTPSSQPSYTNTTGTKTATITGYYKCGFNYNYPTSTSWTDFQVSSVGSITLQTTQTSSEYIYIALPTDLKITAIRVKHPLNDTYEQLDDPRVIDKINSEPLQFTSISSIYRFNIWKLAKAELNANGHPTQNQQPIQITIAKNN